MLSMNQRVQVQGFAWVDDTTSYGAHRWGWASEHVGEFIELQVRDAAACLTRTIYALMQYIRK